MYIIVPMRAIPLIWHTRRDEDKKPVQLEMDMYFYKLMCTTTNTCLEINADTMHQHVDGLIAPRITMHML